MKKKATLLTDMANRTMYGALGALDREAITDLVLIERSVAGANDLIKYGLDMCLREMSIEEEIFEDYCGIFDMDKAIKFTHTRDANPEEVAEMLDKLILGFMDDRWGTMYGGPAWAKIALGIKNILVNYYRYKKAVKGEDKIKYGNQTIYSMNLFDNLAHNTQGIFGKLLELESFPKNMADKHAGVKRIENLMDSKNLKNPYEALVMAEKNLDSDLAYREKYLSKIRSSKDYIDAKKKDMEDEIREIRTKKYMISYIDGIIRRIDKIEYRVPKYLEDVRRFNIDDESFDLLLSKIFEELYEVESFVTFINEIKEGNSDFSENEKLEVYIKEFQKDNDEFMKLVDLKSKIYDDKFDLDIDSDKTEIEYMFMEFLEELDNFSGKMLTKLEEFKEVLEDLKERSHP